MVKPVTKTRNLGTRTAVLSAMGLLVASAAVTVVMLTSGPTSSAHTSEALFSSSGASGMDHGSEDMGGMADHNPADVPATSPSVGPSADHTHGSSDMPGMKPDPAHGSEDMPATGASPGHGKAGAAADRPLAPVLGTFGGGASAVMLTAGFLRRRDKARATAKQAARAARRSQS